MADRKRSILDQERVEVAIARTTLTETATPLLVLQYFQNEREPDEAEQPLDGALGGLLRRVLQSGDFQGRRDETLVLYPSGPGGPERVLLVGVGKREDFTVEALRRAVGVAIRQAERLRVREVTLSLGHLARLSERMGAYHAARTAVEGAILAAWDFTEFKTQEERDGETVSLQRLVLLAREAMEADEFARAAQYGEVTARCENLARQLASRPGNVATPSHLASVAEAIGREHGLKVTVLDRGAIEREGMQALLAVARGSEEEPRFIALEYRCPDVDGPPVVIIGKGVTFDSGGISIKPAERMEEMKYDMSGAAAVLGAMKGIAELALRVNVVGLIPATENLPSGRAMKPGDIIGSHLGKTIEVVNTDAEGRLILADALSYARRYEPKAILNAATLTGACVVALGHHAIGLMGNDGALIDEVRAAGQRVGERCWPLPLWDEYREQLKSEVADLKNSGGRWAGTITAGWFLKEFAGEVPWAHLDIAGTAYRDQAAPYLRKGATGVPTRLFIEWVQTRAAS